MKANVLLCSFSADFQELSQKELSQRCYRWLTNRKLQWANCKKVRFEKLLNSPNAPRKSATISLVLSLKDENQLFRYWTWHPHWKCAGAVLTNREREGDWRTSCEEVAFLEKSPKAIVEEQLEKRSAWNADKTVGQISESSLIKGSLLAKFNCSHGNAWMPACGLTAKSAQLTHQRFWTSAGVRRRCVISNGALANLLDKLSIVSHY